MTTQIHLEPTFTTEIHTFFPSSGSLEPSRFTTYMESSSAATFFLLTPNKVEASSGGDFTVVEPPTMDFDKSAEGWLGEEDDEDGAVECTLETTAVHWRIAKANFMLLMTAIYF